MAGTDLTAQRLRELLDYNPETGDFVRRMWRGGKSRPGTIAGGSHGKTGYIQISVDGRLYFAHRLAWLHYYGVHPTHHIDHIDGNTGNNRIANLRDVPRSVNMQNMRKARSDNTVTGILGIYRNKTKFIAHITVEGRSIYIGSYATPEEAHSAYVSAKRKLHQGCTI